MRRSQYRFPEPHMIKCFLCGLEFQYGPHVYKGHRIPAWDMMVCDGCYKGNWDGIVPQTRPHIIPYLDAHGMNYSLNANGWIDWPEGSPPNWSPALSARKKRRR